MTAYFRAEETESTRSSRPRDQTRKESTETPLQNATQRTVSEILYFIGFLLFFFPL
jgi:hypothetical protein